MREHDKYVYKPRCETILDYIYTYIVKYVRQVPRSARPLGQCRVTRACAQEVRTEITFDFHRLGVLLLRAAVRDGAVVARKIATATVCEARIQATVGQYQPHPPCSRYV